MVAFRGAVYAWVLHKKGPVFVAMFKPVGIVIAVIMGVTFLGDKLHVGRYDFNSTLVRLFLESIDPIQK